MKKRCWSRHFAVMLSVCLSTAVFAPVGGDKDVLSDSELHAKKMSFTLEVDLKLSKEKSRDN
ncbi:hypothetical protein FIU95_05275 [Microbulbifer sp. THAF38]|nr:hypothetical protein FIU95_05275 [Microbulbifer sp. THAF38]